MHEQDNPARRTGAGRPEPVRAYATMNTIRALECLAFGALSAPELAERLAVSVRTARRLLKRLALEGFLTQEPGHRRRYHATLRLAALGRQMVEHTPLAHAAAAHLARLAHDTGAIAHLWIPGYNEQLVCALHADGRAGRPTIAILPEVTPAPTSAAGNVLLKTRAHLRSSSYLHLTAEPTIATSVQHRGHTIAALALTANDALDATAAVVTTATQLSAELSARL